MKISNNERKKLLDKIENSINDLTYDKARGILLDYKDTIISAQTIKDIRVIEYTTEEIDGHFAVKITKQTHICGEFGDNKFGVAGDSFVCKNGLRLCSACMPENRLDEDDVVFLRGDDAFMDDAEMCFDVEDYEFFVTGVKQYNEYFSE